jgi:hypothetical protein
VENRLIQIFAQKLVLKHIMELRHNGKQSNKLKLPKTRNNAMIQCLLITYDMKQSMPKSIKILDDYGAVTAVFENHKCVRGDHCIIEGEEKDIVKWLAPFDGIAVGQGSPMFQQFTIMHIKDTLIAAKRKEQIG